MRKPAATDRPAIRADELRLPHEFRSVELSRTRVIELRRELLSCVGEGLDVTGGAGADAPTTPSDPTSNNVQIPAAERPIPASPIN